MSGHKQFHVRTCLVHGSTRGISRLVSADVELSRPVWDTGTGGGEPPSRTVARWKAPPPDRGWRSSARRRTCHASELRADGSGWDPVGSSEVGFVGFIGGGFF